LTLIPPSGAPRSPLKPSRPLKAARMPGLAGPALFGHVLGPSHVPRERFNRYPVASLDDAGEAVAVV
jgi:hypothetical protein